MRAFWLCGALVLATLATIAPGQTSNPAPSSPRIAYDSQCFQIDGNDVFLFSGSFHYFRCPKPLWPDRFQKLKEAGFNTVETYVPWNWHERTPPSSPDDFSKIDMTDFYDWLDMAVNRFGFYVIVRPGPYICAEWDGGGYPQWLVTKRPAGVKEGHWLRSDEPTYLQWCRHWYQAVAKTVGPFQITHRLAGQPGQPGQPGVILWQLENEYIYAPFDAQVKLHELLALAHDARDFGIDVPLITCMSDDPLFRQDDYLRQNVIECRNTYPGYDPASELHNITMLRTYQPEKPRIITELQGGWFSEIGPDKKMSQDQGFTPEQITHVAMLAWAHGYSGTNFYMAFGGTNLGDWAAAMKTTSYDYAAPIRECGGVGPRYFAVQAMGVFLAEHGAKLARSVAEAAAGVDAPDDLTVISRRTPDASRYIFLFNDRRSAEAHGQLHLAIRGDHPLRLTIPYDLNPFEAKVLYLPPGVTAGSHGQWYPAPVEPPQRPTKLPGPIAITEARLKVDPGPPADSWRPMLPGGGVEDAGIFDRRYVYYRADLQSAPRDKPLMFFGGLPEQDSLIAQLNGAPLDIQRRGRHMLASPLPALAGGENQLLLLYENGGRPNSGAGMEARCGPHDPSISEVGFLPSNPPTPLPLRWQISGDTTGLREK